MSKLLFTLFASCLAVLAACATAPPFDMTGVDTSVTPDQAAARADTVRDRRVAWGGTIINTRNLKETTEIEVLGYPLDKSGHPDTTERARHRFLLVRSGYLESADYRPGRLVTAAGTVVGTRQGVVGEAAYTYPVLQADQLYLWSPDQTYYQTSPNVHFGIGVGVILH